MVETAWRNRIVGSGTEAPAQLLANPRNFRRHPAAQQEAMAGALDEVGWVSEVVVNRRSGFVVDGHLRVELAMRRDEATVPVKYVDLDDAEEALVLATFDPLGAMATRDLAALEALLAEVETQNAGLQTLLDDLAASLAIPEPHPPPTPFLPSAHLVEIYCGEDDLAEFQTTLDAWGARDGVTVNIA
jgi:hypothetical protein